MTFCRAIWRTFAALAMMAGVSASQDTGARSVVCQSLEDSWWTGPLLANSAATLPRGHFLIEPYFYDVISTHKNGLGSSTYLLYGLTNRFTVGLIPVFGYNRVSDGLSSSAIGMGDLAPLAQYRLTQFHPGSWIPATALQFRETLPTAKYDRLGDRPSDGIGSGAYTTTLSLNSQMYFWMPNGRILRMRFNVSQAFSRKVEVKDVSIYGTSAGFSGHASPGGSLLVNAAWEYSLTRKWVPALDVIYQHNGNTNVAGYNLSQSNSVQNPIGIRLDTGSNDGFGFAPALEYNWSSNLGVIFGARVLAPGHNIAASVTPVVAINFVH